MSVFPFVSAFLIQKPVRLGFALSDERFLVFSAFRSSLFAFIILMRAIMRPLLTPTPNGMPVSRRLSSALFDRDDFRRKEELSFLSVVMPFNRFRRHPFLCFSVIYRTDLHFRIIRNASEQFPEFLCCHCFLL